MKTSSAYFFVPSLNVDFNHAQTNASYYFLTKLSLAIPSPLNFGQQNSP